MKTSISRCAQRAKPYTLSVALACAVTAGAGVAWLNFLLDVGTQL